MSAELLRSADAVVADMAWMHAGPGLDSEGVAEVARAVEALGELRQRWADQLVARQREQLAGLVDETHAPLRLHIGSGDSQLDGWINLDIVGADVDADLRRPLPFADGVASHIYASHVIEHLRHPDEVQGFLFECRRVLGLGGRLRVVTPNMEPYLRAHLASDDEFWEQHRRVWTWWDHEHATSLDRILRYAGVSADPRDPFGHRYGYDAESLANTLQASGFVPIVCAFQASRDPLMRVDDVSKVAGATYRGDPLSLFVEGIRL